MLQNIFLFKINAVILNFVLIKELKKMYHVVYKNMKQHILFNS